jgi:hypothetical protein
MLRRLILLTAFAAVITACASSSVSREELEQARIRTISSPYELVYSAAFTTIRDQQFRVTLSDEAAGRIEGHHEFSRDIERRGNYFVGYDPRAAVALHVEATIVRVDENSSRIEINLIEEVPNRSGSSYQAQQMDYIRRPVREVDYYNTLFDDILSRLN